MGFRGRGNDRRPYRGSTVSATSSSTCTATSSNDDIPINLSFGNFEFEDMKRLGRRGGGVREIAALLRHAQRQSAAHSHMLRSREGLEQRNADLLDTAMRRAAGVKVKDDPKRLAKALAKRRNKKRSSAKKWAERLQKLQKSVDNVVEDRSTARQAAKAQRKAKKNKKKQNSHKSVDKRSGGGGGGGSKVSKKAKKSNDKKGRVGKGRGNAKTKKYGGRK
ncbi:Ribosomal RNA-processing protein 14/surfeit locus protein 6 [Trypanosoma melophagium]|uniref:Ribosomal RNA-processing protein 14/surfeit locus protein 6 n=1 Tax=Trypanosoma melophagium TaxID=715481 RepID=UPI00351A55B3|nr:Ribosomal RNA-processing protein 14/surfeit locus protein 6 [Trypanosoma melophagium]